MKSLSVVIFIAALFLTLITVCEARYRLREPSGRSFVLPADLTRQKRMSAPLMPLADAGIPLSLERSPKTVVKK
ncbi:hypothetical protein AB6A40_009921 [Gnathostoma spinigerum]|uniref:Uncharacterized protein n=1 Tax=Gnathostoma spinigerum TaxID=75299 RepID=A0ABD6F1R1_9BILA